MSFFKKRRFSANKNRLLSEAMNILDSPSCCYAGPLGIRSDTLLMGRLSQTLDAREDEVAQWTATTDYLALAYKLLYHLAFDSLTSGQFHICRGELNPASEALHLVTVCNACLDWYVSRGIISPAQKTEQEELLVEEITVVG